jgi:hypothetical protein
MGVEGWIVFKNARRYTSRMAPPPNSLAEQSSIDLVTHGLLSFSLLEQLARTLTLSERDTLTVHEFFKRFQAKHDSSRFGPWNEGVLLAGFYLTIVFVREKWRDLIPDVDLNAWNITPIILTAPEEPNLSRLRYVVRRIRNSVGHTTPVINVPAGTTPQTMATAVTVSFADVNQKRSTDTFDITLRLRDAYHLANKLHETVHNSLAGC